MRRSGLPLLCVVLGAIPISTANAQFSSDYQTNIISGVVSNWSGDYIVGNEASFDVLHIANGGLLINSLGYIGRQSTASNNAAIVDGGSVWRNGAELFVGYDGAGNSLTIANGGFVSSLFGAIGNTSSNNHVLITDSGSIWSNPADLFVGNGGSGNSLTISNGGAAYDANCWVGNNPFSSNNSVLVTGTGSVLSNSGDLYFGDRGGGDSLIIANAGKMYDRYGHVGFSGSNNTVLITGSDSAWNSETLFVGYNGSSNQVTITNGASVVASNAYVSVNSKATGNVINLLGGSLLATNGMISIGHTGAGEMRVSNGTLIAQDFVVGYTNGGTGTVTINGGLTTTSLVKIGYFGGSTGAVLATDANLICNRSVFVGGGGVGTMLLSNSTASFIGGLAVGEAQGGRGTFTAVDSTVNVSLLSVGDWSGTGSVWITGGQLTATTNWTTYVGNFGTGLMTCSNTVINLATLTVCASSTSAGTLTISGGTFTSRQMEIGYPGFAKGAVWICDGATVTATNNPSFVGEDGDGMLTVSNSTVILGSVTLCRFGLADSRGTLTAVSGTVTILGSLIATTNNVHTMASIWLTGGQIVATNGPTYLGLKGTAQMVVSNGVFLAQDITVAGANSTFTLANGSVSAKNAFIGTPNCDGSGTVRVVAGMLQITNNSHGAILDVRSGSFFVTGGNVVVDTLIITNACGRFIHSAGNLVVSALVLDPAMDADGDGMPNSWEQSHGLDPLNPADATADNDGDGQNNLAEFLAGTDPMDSASAFRITSVAQEGADVRVIWQTGIGKTNALEHSPGAAGDGGYYNNFAAIFTVTNAGSTVTNYLDVGAATNYPSRFYRVRLVP